jgi:hypothetical protein
MDTPKTTAFKINDYFYLDDFINTTVRETKYLRE